MDETLIKSKHDMYSIGKITGTRQCDYIWEDALDKAFWNGTINMDQLNAITKLKEEIAKNG
jgi:hypothetical protein